MEKADQQNPEVDPCLDKAQFKMLAPGLSGRDEIQIVNEADLVRVRGNGINATVDFIDCNGNNFFTLTFVDGLITSAVNATLQVPFCPSNPS